VLNYKVLQTIIAMITEDKVTEIFCIADDFCNFFWCYDGKIYAEIRQKASLSPRFYHVKGRTHVDYDSHSQNFAIGYIPVAGTSLLHSSIR